MTPRPAGVLLDGYESPLTKVAFRNLGAFLLAMGRFADSAAGHRELCLRIMISHFSHYVLIDTIDLPTR